MPLRGTSQTTISIYFGYNLRETDDIHRLMARLFLIPEGWLVGALNGTVYLPLRLTVLLHRMM